MNKTQAANLEIIKDHFLTLAPDADKNYPGADYGEMTLVLPYLKKMAKSGIDMATVLEAITNYHDKGAAVPCIALGIIPCPKTKTTWMAGIRRATEPLTLAEAVEKYGNGIRYAA